MSNAEQGEPVEQGPARWLVWLTEKLRTDRIALQAVLVMGALVFLPFLGTLGLWDPWETHYGEVARAMIQRDDFVYPYWESAYFFSKPALTLWLMALGLKVAGAEGAAAGQPLGAWAEWGARLPFALLAILALWAVFRIGRQLKDRVAGFLAAFVLASSAQFIFIGKQAMADMPLVASMTAALALFVAAVFDREEDGPPSQLLKILTTLGIAVATLSQVFLIARQLNPSQAWPLYAAGVLALAIIGVVWLKASRRDCWLAGFYVFMGLAALAKGLAVLAVVGPVVLLYILLTDDLDILKRSRLLLGGVLFLLVASPWYVTMSLFNGRDDENLTFRERFWMHDNFSRVGAGVHGDRGGLAYYIEQVAYGMFPWAALIPFSVAWAGNTAQSEPEVQRRRLLIFLLVWVVWTYVFFTMNMTKFHHYIFPAVPGLAILVALWLSWAAEEPAQRVKPAVAFVLVGLFAVAARDLLSDPKNLVNLFTYKYDRDFPRDVAVRPYLGVIIGIGAWGALSLAFSAKKLGDLVQSWHWLMFPLRFWQGILLRKKGHALLVVVLSGGLFGAWISHHHFNMLSPHWSQAHLFQTYYKEKRGNEPIYAYQLNWRGETFYSRNSVLQVKESGANERMRQLVDQPGREFIITEQSRFQTLKGILSPEKRDKIEIVDRSNNKFYLCVVGD